MKRYLVELEAEEREALEAITRKGSHRLQKVVNALVLLNCDEGEFNERRATGGQIAGVLRISARRVDRVKERFVEDGLEAALGNRQGRRYFREADGEFEARLVALSCGDPSDGRAKWSLRLLADRAVELGYIDSVSHETVRRVLKNHHPTLAAHRLLDPAAAKRRLRGGDGAGARHLPASLRRQLARRVHGRDAAPADRRDAHARPRGTGTAGPRGLRVPAARDLQRVHGDRTADGLAPHRGDRAQNQDRLGPLPARHRRAVPRRHPDHPSDGQPQHAPPRRALGPLRVRLHSQRGSRLNVAEVELNVLIRQCLNRRIDSIDTLRAEVAACQAARDRIRVKVNWQFTTDDARGQAQASLPDV